MWGTIKSVSPSGRVFRSKCAQLFDARSREIAIPGTSDAWGKCSVCRENYLESRALQIGVLFVTRIRFWAWGPITIYFGRAPKLPRPNECYEYLTVSPRSQRPTGQNCAMSESLGAGEFKLEIPVFDRSHRQFRRVGPPGPVLGLVESAT